MIRLNKIININLCNKIGDFSVILQSFFHIDITTILVNKKMKKIFLLLFCLSITFITFAESKDAINDLKSSLPDKISDATIIQRENRLRSISAMYKEINELIKNNQYEKAAANFLVINKMLYQLGDSEYIKLKIKELEQTERDFYKKWSDYIESQANTAFLNKEWEKSIELAKESLILLKQTNNDEEAAVKNGINLINKAEARISNEHFEKITSLDTIVPENTTNKYDIDIYFRKAESLIKTKQYHHAATALENILVLDPYNFNAMYMLKDLYKKIYSVGKERTDALIREKVGQVNWDMNPPLHPKNEDESSLEQIVVESFSNSKLQQKLDSIIIPKIEFDDASLSSVLSYLNSESKELDIEDKAGINIILRLTTSEDELNRITMSMDDIPFGEVIKYICLATGLKYVVEEHAVIIGNESFSAMETKYFTIETGMINSIVNNLKFAETEGEGNDAEFLNVDDFGKTERSNTFISSTAIVAYFTVRGVPFAAGATAAWDKKSNTLVVTNTTDNLLLIEKLLEKIDIEMPLVMIETKFVEINQTDLDEFGFDWKFDFSAINANSVNWGLSQFDPAQVVSPESQVSTGSTQQGNDSILNHYGMTPGLFSSATNPSTGALIKNLTFNSSLGGKGDAALSFWLYALDRSGNAEILSSPKVTTKSGTPATIRMVRTEYYPVSWSEPTASISNNTVQINFSTPTFEDPTDLGIILEVTPTVSPNNYSILLELHPVISNFVGWTDYNYNIYIATTSLGKPVTTQYNQPVRMSEIYVRDVVTKVKVYDGNTVVLGGMITDDTTYSDDVVPILGDTPLIGRLFRSEFSRSVKKNLLIFVTARLIKPDGTPIRNNNNNSILDFKR